MDRLQLYLFPICPSVTPTPAPWWAGERSSAYLLVWIFMDLLLLDTRLLTPGRGCDHDSVARRLLISCRLNLLGWSPCRPQPWISQHLWRDDLCILLSRYLLTLRFTLLHNSQFRYMKYFCRKILDISTSLFSVENEILLPRPGDWDLVTTAATPRIFYYPAALGRGYPHICKN